MLCEGSSTRSVERMTAIHGDTLMRLGVRMGEGCEKIMDDELRVWNPASSKLMKFWGFVGMKKKTARMTGADKTKSDVWTWIALDAETKLVPTQAKSDATR